MQCCVSYSRLLFADYRHGAPIALKYVKRGTCKWYLVAMFIFDLFNISYLNIGAECALRVPLADQPRFGADSVTFCCHGSGASKLHLG